MSKSIIEQSDLENGYTYFETVVVWSGSSVAKTVVLRGGKHPKCRLLLKDESTLIAANAGPSGDFSYLTPVVYSTKTPVLAVIHRDGGIAAVNITATAAGDICPLIESEANEDVFEADEDVVIYATAAGQAGATSIALVVLKFEVVN